MRRLEGRPAAAAVPTLLAVLALFLAGAFTLDRLHPALPALDLSWIGLVVCFVLFVVWSTGARRLVLPRPLGQGVLALLLWTGWMAVSSLWAPNHARLAQTVSGLVIMAAVVLILAYLAVGTSDLDRLLDRLWTWLYWIAAVYLVAALVAGPGAQGRYAAFGGGPNVFVRIMVLGILAALVRVVQGRRWAVVLGAGFAVGAMLSGSRGGLLAAGLVGCVAIVPLSRGMSRRVVVGVLLGLVTSIAAVVALVPAVRLFVVKRFVQQTLEEQHGSGRGSIYGDVLDIARSHPLTGAGLDSYYALVGRIKDFEHPHNLLLATASDGGLVGLVLVVSAVVLLTRAALGTRDWQVALLLGAGWFVLVASMFSGHYYDSRFAWFFLVLAAARGQRPPDRVVADQVDVEPRVRWWAQDPEPAGASRRRPGTSTMASTHIAP